MLRLLVSDLPLRGRGETIGQQIAVIVHILLVLSGRPLLTALRQRLCGLRGGNQSEVMLGVLQIIFRRDRISARMSVSCELEIFFRNVMRVAAYFHVGPVRLDRIASKDWAHADCSSAGRASSYSDLVSF